MWAEFLLLASEHQVRHQPAARAVGQLNEMNLAKKNFWTKPVLLYLNLSNILQSKAARPSVKSCNWWDTWNTSDKRLPLDKIGWSFFAPGLSKWSENKPSALEVTDKKAKHRSLFPKACNKGSECLHARKRLACLSLCPLWWEEKGIDCILLYLWARKVSDKKAEKNWNYLRRAVMKTMPLCEGPSRDIESDDSRLPVCESRLLFLSTTDHPWPKMDASLFRPLSDERLLLCWLKMHENLQTGNFLVRTNVRTPSKSEIDELCFINFGKMGLWKRCLLHVAHEPQVNAAITRIPHHEKYKKHISQWGLVDQTKMVQPPSGKNL